MGTKAQFLGRQAREILDTAVDEDRELTESERAKAKSLMERAQEADLLERKLT